MGNRRLPVLCDSLVCTGCAACSNICPKDAIRMTAGKDGFLRPVVDTDRCVKCLACENTCPVLHSAECPASRPKIPVFACWNKDSCARWESSSGGAFSALATAIFAERGFVAGAVYDESMTVRHQLCHSMNDLMRLRGSKYVQSEIGTVFREIKERLVAGNTVLFVGTPCQVAGIRAYLRKDYEKLYCY